MCNLLYQKFYVLVAPHRHFNGRERSVLKLNKENHECVVVRTRTLAGKHLDDGAGS